MGHRSAAGAAGLLLALAIAGPAAANTQDRFSFHDELVETYSCGVVLTTQVSGEGTAHLAADGTWLFTTVRLFYDGVALDPTSGSRIELTGRQIAEEAPGAATSRGQGIFLRIPGSGVVLHDVGRLVFDPSDGSTIQASGKVIAFDDPTAAARIDAAVCSLFD